MPKLSRAAVAALVHQALVARVSVLIGQSGYDHLLAEQERVSLALARGGPAFHGKGDEGVQALAQAVIDAFELDPVYYAASDLDFLIAEGLTSAGLALADAVRGHERASRSSWERQVLPRLDEVAAFVVSVFDGRWAAQTPRQPLTQVLRERA